MEGTRHVEHIFVWKSEIGSVENTPLDDVKGKK